MAQTVKPAAASKATASPAKNRTKPAQPAKPAAAPAKKSTSALTGERKPKPKPASAEQRRHYIEVAAYYRAERRGFTDTDPAEDWMQAEIEVDRLLAEGKLNS